MKHKNNYYGKPLIFGKARCRIPMNLQFFAESSGVDGGSAGEGSEGGDGTTEQNNTPTIEELMTQLAQERAEKARLKNSFDTASSELASTKKQLRAKMSAEEAEAEAKKEADEAKDARIQELESKFRMMDYSKRYMGIGLDEKTAETLSEITGELSDADKFFSALDNFIKGKIKAASEDAIQELIKNNPEIKAGSGETEKNSAGREKAKEIANRRSGADTDILKHYI